MFELVRSKRKGFFIFQFWSVFSSNVPILESNINLWLLVQAYFTRPGSLVSDSWVQFKIKELTVDFDFDAGGR